MKKNFLILIILILVLLSKKIEAKEIFLDQEALKRGYTIIDEDLTLAILSDSLNGPSSIIIRNLGKDFKTEERKTLISNIYEIEIKQEIKKPYILKLKYNSENETFKAIYFYNQELNKWSKILPSLIDKEKKTIKTILKIPYLKVAILEKTPLLGKATYYSKHFQGRKTASGERFDRFKMTAAMNIVKLKTYVKVTNLENNKNVIVKVNDRGKLKNTIIDMSEASFKKIASKRGQGVMNVKVEELTE